MDFTSESTGQNWSGIRNRGRTISLIKENGTGEELRYKMGILGLPLFVMSRAEHMALAGAEDWKYIHEIESAYNRGESLPSKIVLPSFPTDAAFYMNAGAISKVMSGLNYEDYLNNINMQFFRLGKKFELKFKKDTIKNDLIAALGTGGHFGCAEVIQGYSKFMLGQTVVKANSWEYYGYLVARDGLDLEKAVKNCKDGKGARELNHELEIDTNEDVILSDKFPSIKAKKGVQNLIGIVAAPHNIAAKDEIQRFFPMTTAVLLNLTQQDRDYLYTYTHRMEGNCQKCGENKSFCLPSGIDKNDEYFQLRVAHTSLVIGKTAGLDFVSEPIKKIAKLLYDMGIKDMLNVTNSSSFQILIDQNPTIKEGMTQFSTGLNSLFDNRTVCLSYETTEPVKQRIDHFWYRFARKIVEDGWTWEKVKDVLDGGFPKVKVVLDGGAMPERSLRDFIIKHCDDPDWKRGFKDGLKNNKGTRGSMSWASLCNLSVYEMSKKLAELGGIYVDKEIISYIENNYGWNFAEEIPTQPTSLNKFACATLTAKKEFREFVNDKYKNMYRWNEFTYKKFGRIYNDFNGCFTFYSTLETDQFLYGFRNGLDEGCSPPNKENKALWDAWEFGRKLAGSDFTTCEKVAVCMRDWYNAGSNGTFLEYLKKNGGYDMTMAAGTGIGGFISNKAGEWKDPLESGAKRGLVRSLKNQIQKAVVDYLASQKKGKGASAYRQTIEEIMKTDIGEMIVYTVMAEIVRPAGKLVRMPESITSFVSKVAREEIAANVSEKLSDGAISLLGDVFSAVKTHLGGFKDAFSLMEESTTETATREVADANLVSLAAEREKINANA